MVYFSWVSQGKYSQDAKNLDELQEPQQEKLLHNQWRWYKSEGVGYFSAGPCIYQYPTYGLNYVIPDYIIHHNR